MIRPASYARRDRRYFMEAAKKKDLNGVLLALAAGLFWSISGAGEQYLAQNTKLDSGWVIVLRLFISGAVYILLGVFSHSFNLKKLLAVRSDAIRLLAFSLFGLMLIQYSYIKAVTYSNSGTATSIQYSGEALVMLVTCLLAKRRPRLAEFGGLLLMLTGIFLISTHGKAGSLVLSKGSLIWGGIDAFCLMLYTVLPRDLVSKYGPYTVMGTGMLTGSLVLALILRIWSVKLIFDLRSALCLMLIVIAVGTVIPFLPFMKSIVILGPIRTGMISSVETIITPVIAALWLHTHFTPADIAGSLCMFAMVMLLSVGGKCSAVRRSE